MRIDHGGGIDARIMNHIAIVIVHGSTIARNARYSITIRYVFLKVTSLVQMYRVS